MDLPGDLPRFDRLRPTEGTGTARLDLPRASGGARAGTEGLPSAPGGSLPLLRCAWPLLSVMERLAGGYGTRDPDELRRAVAVLVEGFPGRAAAAHVPPGEAVAARYLLCTAFDEAVLTTPWGQNSTWGSASLLSTFHGETWGGERVYAIIERALADPAEYRGMIELAHMAMLLGFQGRFRRERDGTARADAVRERLRAALAATGAEGPGRLTLPPPPPGTRRRPLFHYVPVWTVAVFCVLLSMSVFGWLDYVLTADAAAVAGTLDGALRGVPDARAAAGTPDGSGRMAGAGTR